MAAAEPFVDLALSTRLESAEGEGCAAFVEARAAIDPASGAEWREIGGAKAMFDGVGSPVTQTFGLGLSRPVSPDDLEAIETFFRERGASTVHEVSPLAGVDLAGLLVTFGYMPVELTSVMYMPLSTTPSNRTGGHLKVREVTAADADLFVDLFARGWGDTPEFRSIIGPIARASLARRDGRCLIAELDGLPVATGALFLHAGVALFAGASTVPEARRRGAQSALLSARLRLASEGGCDIAMMCAAPGSESQRNAERNGFRIAYTRTKWQRT